MEPELEFVNDRPVVLGTPLFGNLFSMEQLGLKIARDDKFNGEFIRDTWLIEFTGGPNTECDECPNYDYDDLTDYYWPALLGGVLKYANATSVDYIGYSAGGGVGIKSYQKYYLGNSSTMGYYVNSSGGWQAFNLSANFVDHIALIAPMGAFNGTTIASFVIDICGDEVLDDLQGNEHVNRREIIEAALTSCANYPGDPGELLDALSELPGAERTIGELIGETSDISYGFWSDIVNDVQNTGNPNPSLSSINKLLIVYGKPLVVAGSDGVIPQEDIDAMYDDSNTTTKYKARIGSIHSGMQDNPSTYNPLVSKFLNERNYSLSEKLRYWIEEN